MKPGRKIAPHKEPTHKEPTHEEVKEFLAASGGKLGFDTHTEFALPSYPLNRQPTAKVDVAWRGHDKALLFIEVESGNERPYANLLKVLDDVRPPRERPRWVVFVGLGSALTLVSQRLQRAGRLGPRGAIAFSRVVAVDLGADWKSTLLERILSEVYRTETSSEGEASPASLFNSYRPLLDAGFVGGAVDLILREAWFWITVAKKRARYRNHARSVAMAAAEMAQKLGRLPEARDVLNPVREWLPGRPRGADRDLLYRLGRVEAKIILQGCDARNYSDAIPYFDDVVSQQPVDEALAARWRVPLLRAFSDHAIAPESVTEDYEEQIARVLTRDRSSIALGNCDLAHSLVWLSRGEFRRAQVEMRAGLSKHFAAWGSVAAHDTIAPAKTIMHDIYAILLPTAHAPEVEIRRQKLLKCTIHLLQTCGLTPKFEGLAEVRLAAMLGGVQAPSWRPAGIRATLREAAGSHADPSFNSTLLTLANKALELYDLDPISFC